MSEVLKVDPIGGQAVIEGVMMRGAHGVGLAIRQPDGGIHIKQEALASLRERYPVLKWPFLRGVAALFESLSLGMRMLEYSAQVASGEEVSEKGGGNWFAMAIGVVGLIAVFKLLPAWLSGLMLPYLPGPLARSGVEGLMRVSFFVGYLSAISLMPEIKRLFQYHGAEHQVINCVEAGRELTPDNALSMSPIHPRCGTSFLLVTLLLQIAVFSLIPNRFDVASRVVVQLILLIPVAGLSFELIRLAGRASVAGSQAGLLARLAMAVTLPGQWLQRITTRPASLDQIEVAIASLNAAQALKPSTTGSVPLAP